MTRPMTKEEFLAAWQSKAPPRREEPELAPLKPRQRADLMVEVHRLSFNATKALLKAQGIRLAAGRDGDGCTGLSSGVSGGVDPRGHRQSAGVLGREQLNSE